MRFSVLTALKNTQYLYSLLNLGHYKKFNHQYYRPVYFQPTLHHRALK